MNLLDEYMKTKSVDERANCIIHHTNDFQKWFDEKCNDFEFISKLAIKYMAQNCTPHDYLLISSTHSELVSGKKVVHTDEFIEN